jgi:hypothetical protein
MTACEHVNNMDLRLHAYEKTMCIAEETLNKGICAILRDYFETDPKISIDDVWDIGIPDLYVDVFFKAFDIDGPLYQTLKERTEIIGENMGYAVAAFITEVPVYDEADVYRFVRHILRLQFQVCGSLRSLFPPGLTTSPPAPV